MVLPMDKYRSIFLLGYYQTEAQFTLTHIEMRHLVMMTGLMRILVGISLSRVTLKIKNKERSMLLNLIVPYFEGMVK